MVWKLYKRIKDTSDFIFRHLNKTIVLSKLKRENEQEEINEKI